MTNNVTEIKKPALKAGGGVHAIVPQDIDQAFRLATAITQSDMAPKSYGRDANKVMVAIMQGMEVGMTPMVALQSIAVINGVPSIWGDGALGLVRSSGYMEDFEETIEGDGDDRKATCKARRKEQKTPIIRSFTMAEAKRAGLTGKDPWKKYPDRMLQMRARSYALRDGFADVLRGLRFVEEVRDMKDMGELEETESGTYAPAETPRPTLEDFEAPSMYILDEFGENIGVFTKSDFVEKTIEIIERTDNENRAAFMEHNADAIESLGTRSKERKAIAEAFSAATSEKGDTDNG